MEIKLRNFLIILLFCMSPNVKSQNFGYGHKCEEENSLAFAKAIYKCVSKDKIERILDDHCNYFGIIIGYLRVNNDGDVLSARIRSIFNELTEEEIENISKELIESKYRFKKCIDDLYFKANEKTLLEQAQINYEGKDLPIAISFPGALLDVEKTGK